MKGWELVAFHVISVGMGWMLRSMVVNIRAARAWRRWRETRPEASVSSERAQLVDLGLCPYCGGIPGNPCMMSGILACPTWDGRKNVPARPPQHRS